MAAQELRSTAKGSFLAYPRGMTWVEGHDDELRAVAYCLASPSLNLADKWASSALRAGEFQWAIESMLAMAVANKQDLPRNLLERIRDVSEELVPNYYRHQVAMSHAA